MKLKSLLTLVAVFGGGLISQLASAQGVLYLSNTNAASNGSQSVDSAFSIYFTTGNNAEGYTIDSVALLLAANPEAEGDTIIAGLFFGSSENPLNSMQENTGDLVSDAAGYVVFYPDSYSGDTSLLTANTDYRIEFGWSGGNTLNVSSTTNLPTVADNWGYSGTENTLPSIPVFDVIATPVAAVPEPSTLALVSLAGLATCWRSRQK